MRLRRYFCFIVIALTQCSHKFPSANLFYPHSAGLKSLMACEMKSKQVRQMGYQSASRKTKGLSCILK